MVRITILRRGKSSEITTINMIILNTKHYCILGKLHSSSTRAAVQQILNTLTSGLPGLIEMKQDMAMKKLLDFYLSPPPVAPTTTENGPSAGVERVETCVDCNAPNNLSINATCQTNGCKRKRTKECATGFVELWICDLPVAHKSLWFLSRTVGCAFNVVITSKRPALPISAWERKEKVRFCCYCCGPIYLNALLSFAKEEDRYIEEGMRSSSKQKTSFYHYEEKFMKCNQTVVIWCLQDFLNRKE